MTNYFRIFTLALLATLFFSACKKRATPQEVALAFMHAIQDSNFDQARDYATKESQQVIQLYSFFDARRSDAEREKIKNARIEVVNMEENGDKAAVTILNSSAHQKEVLQLVKESGQWKISLTFESIIPNYIPPANAGTALDSTAVVPADTASGGSMTVPAVK
ncbi:DUF4878 domain-containing protein [Chitinophaga nivalis]|uniref:DUF4878 domain-containing protein n=1 Tax=Chitinophaga nivalis TaxID=2991709 RepID=A0ABT3IHI7_9BACT|nr:DUF4878 domain-containing protein [Chitinophaga nivalis]MCW3466881.1 DUF4878 domain-containing protein [Chitinophaga nivalis]MCW3483428.1 DUF4878 domain-containing protein [Chitinophaga nivalis]